MYRTTRSGQKLPLFTISIFLHLLSTLPISLLNSSCYIPIFLVGSLTIATSMFQQSFVVFLHPSTLLANSKEQSIIREGIDMRSKTRSDIMSHCRTPSCTYRAPHILISSRKQSSCILENVSPLRSTRLSADLAISMHERMTLLPLPRRIRLARRGIVFAARRDVGAVTRRKMGGLR